MDNSIRKNINCIVGLPSCEYVFSSSKSCFIGYGFSSTQLEVEIIKSILDKNHIEAVEALTEKSYAQNIFCTKICSKIITARFCIIFLNNDMKDKVSMPNANVNMEYGLMLGLNKYIIPFQREDDLLPFNVAGLDTVKYNQNNLKDLAKSAIEQAIQITEQKVQESIVSNQLIEYFLMSNNYIVASGNDIGEKALGDIGSSLKFTMASDFEGMMYMYFGDFRTLRSEVIFQRVRTLLLILFAKVKAIDPKIKQGIIKDNPQIKDQFMRFIKTLKIWIVCQDNDTKLFLEKMVRDEKMPIEIIQELRFFSEVEIKSNLI